MKTPDLKRYKDIVAFSSPQGGLFALHAANLELAEISPQTWALLKSTTYDKAELITELNLAAPEDAEVLAELIEWQNSVSTEVDTNTDSTTTLSAYSLETHSATNKVNSFTINVSQICNLGCSYCVAGGDGTYGNPIKKIDVEKTLPQLKFFLEKLQAGDQARITYLGGEPLLYPEVMFAMARYADQIAVERNLKLLQAVITNGTLITDDIANDLAQMQFEVTVSIDGDKSQNDILRPTKNNKSSTDQVVAGLRKLEAVKKYLKGISLHAVFSSKTQSLLQAFNFFVTLPVDNFEFTLDIHTPDESLMHEFLAQMDSVLAKAFELGGEQMLRKIHQVDKIFQTLDHQQRTLNYCGSGKSLVSLDSDGQVYACPLEVNDSKNAAGKGLKLQEDQLTGRSQNLIEANQCGACWARYFCGGGCMYIHNHLTGSKHKKDKIFCQKTRHLLASTLLYYKICRA